MHPEQILRRIPASERLPEKMKILHLTLKKKWFDMILSGEKKEEYRAIKDYWCRRFCQRNWQSFEIDIFDYCINNIPDTITFTNGYAKDSPRFTIECKGLKTGKPKTKWTDSSIYDTVFIFKLGNIINK